MTIDAAPQTCVPDDRLVALLKPAGWEADRYRMLRRSLERTYEPARRQVIGVASAAAGEGKTTTAANFAAIMAEVPNTRVLLVDADFRCSSVSDVLGLRVQPAHDFGEACMSDYLTLMHTVVRVPELPFDIAPSQPRPQTAHAIVESPRLAQLLQEARERYDVVVVDTPPLVPLADGRALARWVDGFIMVVTAHRTSRKMLGEALKQLEPRQLLGMVFNADDEPAWAGTGRYYLRYGPQ